MWWYAIIKIRPPNPMATDPWQKWSVTTKLLNPWFAHYLVCDCQFNTRDHNRWWEKSSFFFFFFLYRNWLHSLIWSHTITFSRKQNFGDSTSLGDPIFVRKIWLRSSKILSLDSLSVLFPPSFCIHLPKSFPAANIRVEKVLIQNLISI